MENEEEKDSGDSLSDEEEHEVRRSSRIRGKPTVFTYDAIGGKPVIRYR